MDPSHRHTAWADRRRPEMASLQDTGMCEMLRCPNAIEAPLLQGNRELWRVMEFSVKNIAPPNFMSSPLSAI